MQILCKDNNEEVNILINEFIVTVEISSKEVIPVRFLQFIREKGFKVEDGEFLNELCLVIEKKCFK